jgi:hypothetical protein
VERSRPRDSDDQPAVCCPHCRHGKMRIVGLLERQRALLVSTLLPVRPMRIAHDLSTADPTLPGEAHHYGCVAPIVYLGPPKARPNPAQRRSPPPPGWNCPGATCLNSRLLCRRASARRIVGRISLPHNPHSGAPLACARLIRSSTGTLVDTLPGIRLRWRHSSIRPLLLALGRIVLPSYRAQTSRGSPSELVCKRLLSARPPPRRAAGRPNGAGESSDAADATVVSA